MVPRRTTTTVRLPRAATGIDGLDALTGGGWPRGRTTLIEGGPGSGKTLFALQSLVRGGLRDGDAGIFVTFEESPDRVQANASTLGWRLGRAGIRVSLVDARPSTDIVTSGAFDVAGLLATLQHRVRQTGARRIVLDAVDVLLALLPDEATRRREVHRIHDWLLEHGLTAVLTAKSGTPTPTPNLDYLPFMVDCALVLDHQVVDGVSQRSVRVVKYRGAAFVENPAPFVIGGTGIEVALMGGEARRVGTVTTARISTGVTSLDQMLEGGYYRGSSTLITGSPGTAKTTLCGAFAAAACRRGERTLFVSFDSDAPELVRNLGSVGLRLGAFVRNGLLRLEAIRTGSASAEIHLMTIRNLAQEHKARCVLVDPLSALSMAGTDALTHGVAERLITWTKAAGITLVCSSLLDHTDPSIEGTPLRVSTIADTWIHLSYLVRAGERNRGLSIIKSRGTAHSNQVRELMLSRAGIMLADVFTAGGDVLMGTARWEREQAARESTEAAEARDLRQQDTLAAEEADLEAQVKAARRALAGKRAERRALLTHSTSRTRGAEQTQRDLRARRGGRSR